MAKRKRLTPARPDYLDEPTPAPETKSMFPAGTTHQSPPIAQVAGSSAAQAALEEVSDALRSARAEGRLVQALPLDAVDAAHLVRDRMVADDNEMSVLIASLRARGQQTPIEVVALDGDRFGLISGWRRLTALKALHKETGEDRFASVLALLRRPENASDAYLAMVEENEIRVGLSYYERARIAVRAAGQGVYPDESGALRGLFASASRAKRSKIGSFMALYHALDGQLRFGAMIPERLGLALVKVLKDDPVATRRIKRALHDRAAETAEQEAEILTEALANATKKKSNTPETESVSTQSEVFGRVRLEVPAEGAQATLSGPGLSAAFLDDLRQWLRQR